MSEYIFCEVCGTGFTDGCLWKNDNVFLCDDCKDHFESVTVEGELEERKCPECKQFYVQKWHKEDTLIKKCAICDYNEEIPLKRSPCRISVVKKVKIVTHSVKL